MFNKKDWTKMPSCGLSSSEKKRHGSPVKFAFRWVELFLYQKSHSSADFWYIKNSCVNAVKTHFPWSIQYISYKLFLNYKQMLWSNTWGISIPRDIMYCFLLAEVFFFLSKKRFVWKNRCFGKFKLKSLKIAFSWVSLLPLHCNP